MVTKESKKDRSSPMPAKPRGDRQERLAQALRANLKRRKEQARARQRPKDPDSVL